MRLITLITLSAAMLMAMPGLTFAQDEEPKEEKKQEKSEAEQQAERRVGWVLRQLKGQLELSDSQSDKIKEILMATEMKQSKMRNDQSKQIEALLTPDQQEKYKTLRDRSGRGGRGGRGGREGRRGGMGRMMGLDIESIKEKLGLSPEQEKKIEELIKQATDQGREAFQKMREGGGFDMQKMRELFEKGRNDIREKINGLLDDEQKKKFADLNKEMDERMQQFMGRFGGGNRGDRGDRGGRGRERRPRNPEEMTERRLKEVMTSLKLPDEEAAVLGELIKKVISYQSKTGAQSRTMREEIRKLATGGGDAESTKEKIEDLRKLRETADAKLKTLREGLRELLTETQEAVLISHGVLN